MKKFVYILMLLLCVGIVSCDDESNNDAMVVGVAERNADVTALGGTFTITLSAEADKVVSDQSWCVASISGKTVSLEVETNKGLEGRTALITVTKGTGSTSIPVTQPGNKIPVAQNESVEFDAHGGEMEVTVENVLPFEVTVPTDATWLNARVDKNKLILTTQKNYTLDRLSTTLTLKSGDLESKLEVAQSGIVLIPEKTSVVMYNGGDEVTLKVESTLEFNVSSDQEWLEVTKGDGSILLKAGDNSGKARRTATVTLTSEGLTATVNIAQRPPIYTDYLGSWTLIGMNGNTPFTYNISLTQATANSTYTLAGWSKSGIDEDCPLEVVFNGESGEIEIYAQNNLGVYTDAGGDYDVCFYGMVERSAGSFSFVTGSYISYTGMLQRDGTIQCRNGEVTLRDGDYVLAGSMYCMISRTDGKIYNFNADVPFMSNPIMVKTAMTRFFKRNIISTEKGVGVMIHQE